MLAPVYKTIRTPQVIAIVGARVYGKGSAPQGVATPYVTWFVVTGDPYGNLSDAPDADNNTIQIDCWAGPADDQELLCNQLAKAVRDALDSAGLANRLIIDTREADTKLFRIGLQTEFIFNR